MTNVCSRYIKAFNFKRIGLCESPSQKRQHAFNFTHTLMPRLNKYRARGLVQLCPPIYAHNLSESHLMSFTWTCKFVKGMVLRERMYRTRFFLSFFFFYLLNCLCCGWCTHCWKKLPFCENNISPHVLYVPSCECSTTIKKPIFGSIPCRRSLTGNLSQQPIRYCQSEVWKTCPALLDLDWHCSHESHERAAKEWGAVLCRARAYVCIRLHSA